MTTEKFVVSLKGLGYDVKYNDFWIEIFNGSSIVAEIRVNKLYALNTDFFCFTDVLGSESKEKLIKTIDKYIKTPVEER